jgi:tetratricopeptide (TPR) repeat protein
VNFLKNRPYIFTILIFFLFGSCSPLIVWGGSDSPVLQFEKAKELFKQEEYARALAILQRLEEISPGHFLRPEIAFLTGQTLRSLRKWPEAARAFSLAGEIFPLLGDYALFYQGEAWQEAGETEKSLDAFHQLISLYPQSLSALPGELRRAEIYLERGEFEKAAGVSRNLLASPSSQDYAARALFLLGQAQEGMERGPGNLPQGLAGTSVASRGAKGGGTAQSSAPGKRNSPRGHSAPPTFRPGVEVFPSPSL